MTFEYIRETANMPYILQDVNYPGSIAGFDTREEASSYARMMDEEGCFYILVTSEHIRNYFREAFVEAVSEVAEDTEDEYDEIYARFERRR